MATREIDNNFRPGPPGNAAEYSPVHPGRMCVFTGGPHVGKFGVLERIMSADDVTFMPVECTVRLRESAALVRRPYSELAATTVSKFR
jgi:hypothetical protein